MRPAKTIWHFRKSKNGYEIITPHNRVWGEVRCGSMAAKICGSFNFARELQIACETEDMAKIKSVLLAYKKEGV